MHSTACWSEQMCVPCTKNDLILMTAERDGLGSQLLDVQQDCITAERQLAEAQKYEHDTVLALKRMQNEREAALEALEKAEDVISLLRGSMNIGVVQVPPPIADTELLYALKDAVAAYDRILHGSNDGGDLL